MLICNVAFQNQLRKSEIGIKAIINNPYQILAEAQRNPKTRIVFNFNSFRVILV